MTEEKAKYKENAEGMHKRHCVTMIVHSLTGAVILSGFFLYLAIVKQLSTGDAIFSLFILLGCMGLTACASFMAGRSFQRCDDASKESEAKAFEAKYGRKIGTYE